METEELLETVGKLKVAKDIIKKSGKVVPKSCGLLYRSICTNLSDLIYILLENYKEASKTRYESETKIKTQNAYKSMGIKDLVNACKKNDKLAIEEFRRRLNQYMIKEGVNALDLDDVDDKLLISYAIVAADKFDFLNDSLKCNCKKNQK